MSRSRPTVHPDRQALMLQAANELNLVVTFGMAIQPLYPGSIGVYTDRIGLDANPLLDRFRTLVAETVTAPSVTVRKTPRSRPVGRRTPSSARTRA